MSKVRRMASGVGPSKLLQDELRLNEAKEARSMLSVHGLKQRCVTSKTEDRKRESIHLTNYHNSMTT